MKTKKSISIIHFNVFLVTIERVKNNINGNPKYNISIFNKDTLYFRGNWNIVTYDLKKDVELICSSLKKGGE